MYDEYSENKKMSVLGASLVVGEYVLSIINANLSAKRECTNGYNLVCFYFFFVDAELRHDIFLCCFRKMIWQ